MVSGSASAGGHGRGGGGWHGGTHTGTHSGGHFHHHFSTGVFLGAPLFYFPYSYYPTPYYYPFPSEPTYYVEQPRPGYWHYCRSAAAYYPQVQSCPEGWQLVPPQPPQGGGY